LPPPARRPHPRQLRRPPPAPEAEPAIGKRVNDWAAAWQNKAIDDYLGHYAPDFKPAGKLTHGDWLAQRRQRLSRPGAISVEIIDLQIEQSGDTASARFQQIYRAEAQTLTDKKTLELVRRDGQWLILREYTNG
jgi:ketosteroid isomerase-like protein